MSLKLTRLAGAVAIAASLAFTATAANAGDKKVLLKLPVHFGTHLPGLGTTPKWLADNLKASGSSVKVKIYEPGKLIPPKEILQAVSKGQVNAGFSTPGYNTGTLGNGAAMFSAVPFGPNAGEFLAWIYYGDGRKLWQEMYDKKGLNVHPIPCGLVAPETSGWFSKEINKPEDLKGLRMRFFGLGALVMEKLGVSTSLLSSKEIFPALEKGAIDATEFSMPAIDKNLGFHKILKYNYFPGWHQPSTLFELLINGDTWKSMSKAQQNQVETACKAAILDAYAMGESMQFPVMQENIEKNGVEIRYWSDEMLKAFKEKWDEVVAEESAKDPQFKAIWDNLAKFRKGYAIWGRSGYLPNGKQD
ncbi:MAG: C4-dicarboxylate ABC transporter [Proteobacteria bacterium]|nr:MAG: C4-dicarboxylate ABC transporter [Pseudomonadota bacterium]